MYWFLFSYFLLLGMSIISLFLDSRFSRRRTLLILYGVTVVLMLLDIVWLYFLGTITFTRIYIFTHHIPTFLCAAYCSRYRGWKLLFLVLSAVHFCLISHQCSAMFYYLFGERTWVLFLSYILIAALILFVLYRLRPLYLQVFQQLQHGWWLLCLVLFGYYFISIYLIPGFLILTPLTSMLKPALSVLVFGMYVVILFLFSVIRQETEKRHNAELAAMQLSSLKSRIEATEAAEHALRIERHDLHHRLNTIARLIENGDLEDALSYIGSVRRKHEQIQPVCWCADPVLNAMFSSYFTQAQQNNIQIDAHLDFPSSLPANIADLSTVFANALENSIHACCELPRDKRQIRCRCIPYPKLMIEIANPCAAPVELNDDGFPTSSKSGHGLGLRSIRAFCAHHGALVSCKYADGWFYLRIGF